MKAKAAVIGLGFVGRAHVEALRRVGIVICGGLGSSPETTAQACASLGLARAYASLEEITSDANVDVVHLCTPNYLHFEEASRLLRAGKHVLCEKPLTLDSRESELLVSLAKETQKVGAVAYNLRYYPLCQEARALIEKGTIGRPNLVHGSFLQDWLLYENDWNWRLDPRLGGPLRAVSDIGTHWLDLITWITGRRVTQLCADLATVIPVRQRPRGRVETFQKADPSNVEPVAISTEDYASVLFHLDREMRGVMTVSQVSAGRKARLWFEIDGSEGSLTWNSEEPNTLWMGRRNSPSQELPKDPGLMSPGTRRYAAYPGGHPEGYPDTFVQLFRDLYSYLDVGDLQAPRTFPTFETGHEEMALCEAIEKSAQEHAWVSLGGE